MQSSQTLHIYKGSEYTLFFKRTIYKNNSLNFDKKIKNKLRTKPGLLSHKM